MIGARFVTGVAVGLAAGLALGAGLGRTTAVALAPGGYILERDEEVKTPQPGPHEGGGDTIAYSFFAKAPGLKLVFRKRAFKPGAAIGYHLQKEDEIYYVLSGRGMMTIDDKAFEVGPGSAILTRPGSSHGLKQIGSEDLVILINYERQP
ncbi:MAG TPA: cupin domain-containing protein [Vicinamibacterales bacterium]|jgi:mannose-6-phosphate isomerase-like protein (cupin superfamily)|nr:cupin domain-containing protein [Vicinamibacterales bacterium]